MTEPGAGRPGPGTRLDGFNSATYFKKSDASHPYFAIRAMFEDANNADNVTPPIKQKVDGSTLQGPFRFIGFWVTAASPGAANSRAIYMKVTAKPAAVCRDVAQVVAPGTHETTAFTDRVWDQSGFGVPTLQYAVSQQNSPYGAALQRGPIGKTPMLMDPSHPKYSVGTWIQSGSAYHTPANPVRDFVLLSNLFARIYNIYRYYDQAVGPGDYACTAGPFVGKKCNVSTSDVDCGYAGLCYTPTNLAGGTTGKSYCKSGIYSGRECAGPTDCVPDYDYNQMIASFSTDPATSFCKPASNCINGKPCYHSAGYAPIPYLCDGAANPTQCLWAFYGSSSPTALSVSEGFYSPTDVTPGLFAVSKSGVPLFDTAAASRVAPSTPEPKNISGYRALPPVIAAPDTRAECPAAGQCPIAALNKFTFQGQTSGMIVESASQVVGKIKFYAWAQDNQAPLTDVIVDWGDGTYQPLIGERLKNHKPFCGVPKQCQFSNGLSCATDSDCPPSAGKCVDTGVCSNDGGKFCTTDAECGFGNTCGKRLTFGNSDEDCEQNYFEFQHVYQCDKSKMTFQCFGLACSNNGNQSCTTFGANCSAGGGTCGFNPLVYRQGCTVGNACFFTPRVYVKDNWGWCAGLCNPLHPQYTQLSDALFKYGGCYDGSKTKQPNQCDPIGNPAGLPPPDWIPYGNGDFIELQSK